MATSPTATSAAADEPLTQAIAKQEAVLRAMQRQHGEFDVRVSDDLAQLALLLNMHGRHTDALQLLHRRLVIHEKHGPDELIGESLQQLGTTYRLAGHADVAQQHLERALALRERCHGPQSHKVAETLNSLTLLVPPTANPVAAQLRSLTVLLESAEPEDIESEDIPWEVFKRLRQQRGPTTADNSLTLLKGTMRKSLADALAVAMPPPDDDPIVAPAPARDLGGDGDDRGLVRQATVATAAAPTSTPPRSHSPATTPSARNESVPLGRYGRSHSDSTMLHAHNIGHRIALETTRAAATTMHADAPAAAATTSIAPGNTTTPTMDRRGALTIETPTTAAGVAAAAATLPPPATLSDLAGLQRRVEDVQQRIIRGASDMDAVLAQLDADVKRLEDTGLRATGEAMLSMLRRLEQLCPSPGGDRNASSSPSSPSPSPSAPHPPTSPLPMLEGPLEKKSASIFRGWERRWFTVDPATCILSYHFSRDDFARGFAPRGGFPLHRIAEIVVHRLPPTRGSSSPQWRYFDIVVDLSTRLHPRAARTYELRCQREDVLRHWVDSLNYFRTVAQQQQQARAAVGSSL